MNILLGSHTPNTHQTIYNPKLGLTSYFKCHNQPNLYYMMHVIETDWFLTPKFSFLIKDKH